MIDCRPAQYRLRSLNEIIDELRNNGFEVSDEEYHGMLQKYNITCRSCGYEMFLPMYIALRTWCYNCEKGRENYYSKTQLDNMAERVYGGHCQSMLTHTRSVRSGKFVCENGHTFGMSIRRFLRGFWCYVCSGNDHFESGHYCDEIRKERLYIPGGKSSKSETNFVIKDNTGYTIGGILKHLEEQNVKPLDDNLQGFGHVYNYRCGKCGSMWSAPLEIIKERLIRTGYVCYKCKLKENDGEMVDIRNRKSPPKMSEVVHKLALLDIEICDYQYKGSNSEAELLCRNCGRHWYAKPYYVLSKGGCGVCKLRSHLTLVRKQKIGIVNDYLARYGLKLMSSTKNFHEKQTWMCTKCGATWQCYISCIGLRISKGMVCYSCRYEVDSDGETLGAYGL